MPKNLAQELKETAEAVVNGRYSNRSKKIIDEAITKAKKAAASGEYSIEVYSNDLISPTVSKDVSKSLKDQGFRANIRKDDAYSEHVGSTQMCMTVSW